MFQHIGNEFPKLIQETVGGKRHYVTPNGDRYPSVTTVLSDYNKKPIEEWKKRVGVKKAEQVSKIATDRGTSVHSAIERYLNNEDMCNVDMHPNAKTVYVRMKPELNKLNNIHCLESHVWSNTLGLAGTVDCIAEYNGMLSVIDFKTAKRLKKKEHIRNYFMQLAAYATMFTELTGHEIKHGVIMIGVDNVNFCQTFKINPHSYVEELKTYITKYNDKHNRLVVNS